VTIQRGEPWGETVPRPTDVHVAFSDAELSALIGSGDHLGIRGGDLFRTLGAPALRPTAQKLPMDLLSIVADGRPLRAVAHVVARRSWWFGPIVAIMNSDHLGTWNVAPRAHPNDGKLDVVSVGRGMTLRQRLQARTRLELGTHVPHPAIDVRTAMFFESTFERPLRLWVDGVRAGEVRHLRVDLEADAYELFA
jgi:hypothetical protein